jgi:hypothetical protein
VGDLCVPADAQFIKALMRSILPAILAKAVESFGPFRQMNCAAPRNSITELHGELAAIVGLAADSKQLGGLTAAGLAEQIKVVAGRGFEPLTFRL